MTVEQNVLQPGGAAKVRHRHGIARPGPPAAPGPGLAAGCAPLAASLPAGLARAWAPPPPRLLLPCAAPAGGPRPAGNFSTLQRGRSPPPAASRARGKLPPGEEEARGDPAFPAARRPLPGPPPLQHRAGAGATAEPLGGKCDGEWGGRRNPGPASPGSGRVPPPAARG